MGSLLTWRVLRDAGQWDRLEEVPRHPKPEVQLGQEGGVEQVGGSQEALTGGRVRGIEGGLGPWEGVRGGWALGRARPGGGCISGRGACPGKLRLWWVLGHIGPGLLASRVQTWPLRKSPQWGGATHLASGLGAGFISCN